MNQVNQRQISSKTLYIPGFFLIVALIGFYIFQVSTVTQLSFTIGNKEEQLTGLNKEFKDLQVNFSNVGSLSGLEGLLASEGYEKVGKIHYIQLLGETVAVK